MAVGDHLGVKDEDEFSTGQKQTDSSVPALEICNVRMGFGGPPVLKDVSFKVAPGSIHGLLGANGAGKSTLVKILAGIYHPFPGSEITLWGQKITRKYTVPEKIGIGIVHQELPFVADLSVVENMASGAHFERLGHSLISWKKEVRAAQEMVDGFGLNLDVRRTVESLSQSERAQIATLRVLRALDEWGHGNWIVVLDEPTSALTVTETERLLDWMRGIAARGCALLFISHKLREVRDVCDEVTILRDGRVTYSGPITAVDTKQVVEHMIGRALNVAAASGPNSKENDASQIHSAKDESGLELRNLCGFYINDVSLFVRAGEVVGVSGLAGMDLEELPRLIIGEKTAVAGSVLIGGKIVKLSPSTSPKVGLQFVSGNRLADGLWPGGRVFENLTISRLERLVRHGLISRRKELDSARGLIGKYAIRPSDPHRMTQTLSGGNQQKTYLARSMAHEPNVLLLEEPVQGVDISSRQDIAAYTQEIASLGGAVLVVSVDYEFLAATCTRIYILSRGRAGRTLEQGPFSEDDITRACLAESDNAA